MDGLDRLGGREVRNAEERFKRDTLEICRDGSGGRADSIAMALARTSAILPDSQLRVMREQRIGSL